MKLYIFKNAGSAQDSSPLFISVNLVEEVIAPNNSFHVPIHVEDSGQRGKETYSVEICGFRLEAEAPDDLLAPISKVLSGLINSARLPTYIFAASHSLLVYPVYTVGDEVYATTPGGPVFRHVELANVRGFLSDYLHTMEEIGTVGHIETLHVRGIDRNTLGLLRPIFYFKKRVPGEAEFWAPVFLSEDGRTIYTYAASAKREVAIDGGYEILDLHHKVAKALIKDGRLHDIYDLRPDRVFPTALDAMLKRLQRQPYDLSFPYTNGQGSTERALVPLYRNGKAFVAVEHRDTEDRYSIFVGRDPLDIRERVSQDLTRRGVCVAPDDVELLVS